MRPNPTQPTASWKISTQPDPTQPNPWIDPTHGQLVYQLPDWVEADHQNPFQLNADAGFQIIHNNYI